MRGLVPRAMRSLARRVASAAGYELRIKPHGHVWGVDPYLDQVELFHNQPVRMIFDVGANEGQTTARYRQLFPTSQLHSFEPLPDAYARLSAAQAGNPLVTCHRMAASNETGRMPFHVNASDLTSSLLASDPRSGQYVDAALLTTTAAIEVDTIRLDEFCERQCINRIDILKMDVQGAEGLVVAGAEALLRQRRVGLIFTEVQFAPLYKGQTNFREILNQFAEVGYRLFGLYQLVTGPKTGLLWADAIFLPDEATPTA